MFYLLSTEKKILSNFQNTCHSDIPEDVLNTYCWIHSTYTVVDAFMKKQGSEVPFPGIDNSQRGGGQLTIKHTKYYQWVSLSYCLTNFWLSKYINTMVLILYYF